MNTIAWFLQIFTNGRDISRPYGSGRDCRDGIYAVRKRYFLTHVILWRCRGNHQGASPCAPTEYLRQLFAIVWLVMVFILAVAPVQTQDAGDEEVDDRIPIVYGEVVTGQLNDLTPRAAYVFDALRCDFVSVKLSPTSGTLDPVMAVLDEPRKK